MLSGKYMLSAKHDMEDGFHEANYKINSSRNESCKADLA